MTLETRFPEGDWRGGYFGPENLGKTIKRVDKLKEILPKNMSLPQMAFRFILSNPVVSTTIPGMRKPDHVKQNIATSDAGPLEDSLQPLVALLVVLLVLRGAGVLGRLRQAREHLRLQPVTEQGKRDHQTASGDGPNDEEESVPHAAAASSATTAA